MRSKDGGMMDDPYGGIKTERGCLVIYHGGGSSWKWSYTHRYRFQNEAFELIGATIIHGKLGVEWNEYDYNLSTGKIIHTVEKEYYEGDEWVSDICTNEFYSKVNPKPNLSSFQPGTLQVKIPYEDHDIQF